MTEKVRTRLDLQMDKIKRQEEAGLLRKKKNESRFLARFFSSKLTIIGVFIFVIFLVLIIFAPLVTSYDPMKIDIMNTLKPPNATNILGTDQLGRDVFARVLYGGRVSIFVGIVSAFGTVLIGTLLGTYSGYKGGIMDSFFVRISELFMAFPKMVLILLLVAFIGPSLWNLMLIFIFTGWPGTFRMVRATILSIREEEYVQVLKAFDINNFVICFKHMLPNSLSPIIVGFILRIIGFIFSEAGLSFLGLGIPPSIPTWRNMLNVARDISILRNNWWLWLPIGITLILFVLSLNLIGDGVRDSIDPSQQG